MDRDERKLTATATKGSISIDIEELFHSLDTQSQLRVARNLSFDERIVEAVVKWLTTGEVQWDDPGWNAPGHDPEADLPWHVYVTGSKTVLESAREKLLAARDDLAKRALTDAIKTREELRWEAEEYRKLLWKLAQEWSPTGFKTFPDHFQRPYMTKDQVEQMIRDLEAKVKEGPPPEGK